MPSLWRVLALAWLGGVASPALTDDVVALDHSFAGPPEIVAADNMPVAAERQIISPNRDPAGSGS